jgi:hypothetical protein
MRAGKLLLSSARRRAGEALLLSLATSLSVMAIAIFVAAASSPRFSSLLFSNGTIAESVRRLFDAAAAALVFSVGLSGWFYAEHYLKRRKRELASWLLLGMEKGEALAAISAELAVAAAFALALGLGLAAVFSRFFALLLAALMADRSPVPISVGWPSLLAGAAACLGEWLAASLRAAFDISRSSILHLMRAEAELEAPPERRNLGAAAGAVFIAAGYSLAIFTRDSLASSLMLPVLALTVAGTFLSFDSLAPRLIEAFRAGGARRGAAGLIAAAQLSFRARRNTRLLALSTVAVAIAASALGSVMALDLRDEASARRLCPHDVELSPATPESAELVERILARHGASGGTKREIPWIEAELEGPVSGRGPDKARKLQLFSASAWNAALAAMGERAPAVEAGRMRTYLAGLPLAERGKPREIGIRAAGDSLRLEANQEETPSPISIFSAEGAAVLSDEDYGRLGAETGRAVYWDGIKPEAARAAKDELRAAFPQGLVVRSLLLEEEGGLYGVMRFIGAFIAATFAIFAASLIAFRVIEDAKDDAERYRLLGEIGARRETIGRALLYQNLFTFGLPLAGGLCHAAVALIMMRNISGYSNVEPTIFVSALITLCFAAFTALATGRQGRSIPTVEEIDRA